MFDADALAFLAAPRYCRFASNGPDGFPHVVPVWFALDARPDGSHDVILVSERTARKNRNVAADPKAAINVGGDVGDDLGYLIRGTVTIEEDTDKAVLHRLIDHYEADPAKRLEMRDLWAELDLVVLRLSPASVVCVPA